MKKIHYRNIGFPKTGTNWLWLQFYKHPLVDCKLGSNFKEYRGNSIESYKKSYEKYDVSVNLDVHLYDIHVPDDHYLNTNNIHEHTTHVTMILRNPYEVINSIYNMEKNRNVNYKLSQNEHIEKCYKTYSATNSIFNRWDSCKLPVKYMFYDDLKNDPENFFYDICDHIGLKRYYKDIGIKFKTEINDPLTFDNSETIKYINTGISVIEDRLNRDLSHWKKQ
jgi:hypothetical protein